MANIITNAEVFDFIGTPTDVRTNQGSQITALITNQQAELERTLRRSITSKTATTAVLIHGQNANFNGYKIVLTGELRDMYTITALSEEGSSLSQITAYNDGNDYVFNSATGTLERVNKTSWSIADYAITISGKYGYVNTSDDSARVDVKQLLIEIVAMRSGLWTKTFVSDGVEVETEKDKDVYLQNKIAGHINYSIG